MGSYQPGPAGCAVADGHCNRHLHQRHPRVDMYIYFFRCLHAARAEAQNLQIASPSMLEISPVSMPVLGHRCHPCWTPPGLMLVLDAG
jgi:hypothetical protein